MSVAAVHGVLSTDPAIVALVASRIYPLALPATPELDPKTGLPAITLQLISAISVESQDGPSGLARSRVTVNAWGSTYAEATAVAAAARESLGRAAGGTVQGAFFANARDLYDQELKIPGRSIDFLVWHEEE